MNNNAKRILFNVWLYYLVLSFLNPVLFGEITIKLFILATFFIENNYEKEEEFGIENTLDSKYNISISSKEIKHK